MPPSSTRQHGQACRIYKNSDGKVIAIDSIAVTTDKSQISINKFVVSVNSVDVHRTLLHLTVGGSRIVSSIQMIGDYSSLEENAGNYLILKWDASSSSENFVEISLDGKVAKVGDTV